MSAIRLLDEVEAAVGRIEQTAVGPLPVLLSLAEISNLTGCSRQGVIRAMKAGHFPQALDFDGKPVWRFSDYVD